MISLRKEKDLFQKSQFWIKSFSKIDIYDLESSTHSTKFSAKTSVSTKRIERNKNIEPKERNNASMLSKVKEKLRQHNNRSVLQAIERTNNLSMPKKRIEEEEVKTNYVIPKIINLH